MSRDPAPPTIRVGTPTSHAALVAALSSATEGRPTDANIAEDRRVEASMPRAFAQFDMPPPRLRPYTVQIQYLLPIFKHVTVEAETVTEACELAVANDEWGDAKEGHESSSATHVCGVVAGHHPDIYGAGARKVAVPPPFKGEEDLMRLACAALLDSRQAGGPRRSLRRAIALARMALPNHVMQKVA